MTTYDHEIEKLLSFLGNIDRMDDFRSNEFSWRNLDSISVNFWDEPDDFVDYFAYIECPDMPRLVDRMILQKVLLECCAINGTDSPHIEGRLFSRGRIVLNDQSSLFPSLLGAEHEFTIGYGWRLEFKGMDFAKLERLVALLRERAIHINSVPLDIICES